MTSPSKNNDDRDLPPLPSDDWEMTVFLKSLADGMTEEDLKTLKYFLRGFGGSGIQVMESIKDPLDLFQHLRHRGLLNRDNVLVLQSIVWHLGRKDLHAKLVKFSRERGNVLHFYNTEDKPVNGYEYLHFHIAGREKMNRNTLEDLRCRVGRYLCIPPEFIVNTDIELTNSILVTFMIPEGFSNILRGLDDTEKGYLSSMGIDEITIDGVKIKCTDDDAQLKQEDITTSSEMKRLLDSEREGQKEIEALHVQLLNQDKALRKMHSEMVKLEQETRWTKFKVAGVLIQQFVEARYSPKKFSLQDLALTNAQKYFRHALQKTQKLGYDSDLIHFLLESNTLFINIQNSSYHDSIAAQQNAQIRKLQHDVASLTYQKDKLAYHLKVGLSNPILTQNDEFFLKVLAMPLPFPVGGSEIRISTEHGKFDLETVQLMGEAIYALMDRMGKSLSKEEKEAIINRYVGSSRKAFTDSKLSVFRYIVERELNANRLEIVDTDGIMMDILTYIKRKDLIAMWKRESFEIVSNPDTGLERQQSKKQKDQNSESIQRSPPASSTNDSMGDMVERLERIENMLKKNITSVGKDILGSYDSAALYGATKFPYWHSKFGTDQQYDWSKISQSKLFGGRDARK